MIDRLLSVGPFQCNCRILACPDTGEALIVDPGDEPKRILDSIAGLKTQSGQPIHVKYLFHTHAHLDHIGGTRDVKLKHPGAKIALHGDDEELYQALPIQGQYFGFKYEAPLPVDHRLEHEEELSVGSLKFSVIHTPGHSPGGVCLRLHGDLGKQVPDLLFTGDTLFKGSVGRTDLWGADGAQMMRSIRERILVLGDDLPICPGHGPNSQIGLERRSNPFLN